MSSENDETIRKPPNAAGQLPRSGVPAHRVRRGVAGLVVAPFSLLWGVPVVLIGAYSIAGRVVANRARRGRTFSGATVLQIPILWGLASPPVKGIRLAGLDERILTEGRLGTDGIGLGSSQCAWPGWSGMAWPETL